MYVYTYFQVTWIEQVSLLTCGTVGAFPQGHLRPMLYQIIIFVIIVIINHQSCVVLTFATSVPVVCPHWRAHCWSGPGCCNSSTGHLGRQCYSPITDLVLVWDQSSALCRSSTCHPCTCWLTLLISSLSRYLLYQEYPGWMRSCCCCHPCTSVVYV